MLFHYHFKYGRSRHEINLYTILVSFLNDKLSLVLNFPAMLEYALESCCFGCNTIIYNGPFIHFERFYKNSDLVIPVQTSISNTQFFGHNFIHMLEIQAVSFFGEPVKHDPDKIVKMIATSVIGTYPLFLIALVMALTAGVAIWLLVSKTILIS